MPFVTLDDAHQIVHPYFDDFRSIVADAWTDWRQGAIASQMQHKRVRANFVWNQLIAHAKRRFDGNPKIQVETLRDWDGVLIDGKVFVRMKKGTHELLSRNYPTQGALAFHDQIQDLFGGIGRLELLYVLDESEADVERIALIQRHRKSVAWVIDLLKPANDAQNVIPFTGGHMAPTTPTVADRVLKSKKGKKRDDKREPKQGS